ncbi:MAG TPA: site-2 protease family protein [Tepidisphaeraceae bacterium]|nr:site-2 protease family protein [Tepidisphaeraceae bacterium]
MPLILSMVSLANVGMIALMVFGFGFVIFWHELGHFLAAKWVGIRVEQFAVGFGQAVFSWRKGIGFRVGNTQKDYRQRIEQHLLDRQKRQSQVDEKPDFTDAQRSGAAEELALGETEYRLNWIPLGGYVKMLGQDDLRPDAQADDPRAYNRKSIGARMLVISAGVVMNVILAAIMFTALFLFLGFHVPPAWIGNIVPGSPAQKAVAITPNTEPGLRVGDRIITFDGKPQADFTEIMLNTALVKEGVPVRLAVDRPDTPAATSFHRVEFTVVPARMGGDKGFLAIGFQQPRELRGPTPDKTDKEQLAKAEKLMPADAFAVKPGDVITAVNGQAVEPLPADGALNHDAEIRNVMLFDKAVQASDGKPITLTLRDASGATRPAVLSTHFENPFNPPFEIAGMQPRTEVDGFSDDSTVNAPDKLHMGDVIVSIKYKDPLPHPTFEQLQGRLTLAGEAAQPFSIIVLRDGKLMEVAGLKASLKVDKDHYGMGVTLHSDEKQALIAGLAEKGPAALAGLKEGDEITAIAGHPVANWFDVKRLLGQAKAGATVKVSYKRPNIQAVREASLTLDKDQLASVQNLRFMVEAQQVSFAEYNIIRKTSSPLVATRWGITETRDFILQFYVTLQRMVDGSVSPSNMMGPVGIFIGGARFAEKGADWLLWFLAMISANLAVVNFLPIPVVDGGQFVFLILEKIKGKPLSPRTMAIAQYVGLAFLAGVVLFVTWHDIIRRY